MSEVNDLINRGVCPSCTWRGDVELENGVCPYCETNWAELRKKDAAATISGLYNCQLCGEEKCVTPGFCEDCLAPPADLPPSGSASVAKG